MSLSSNASEKLAWVMKRAEECAASGTPSVAAATERGKIYAELAKAWAILRVADMLERIAVSMESKKETT